MRCVIVAGCVSVLAGCVFATQQPIEVKPELVSVQNRIGAGKSVLIDVADERPSKNLGNRGVNGAGSELTVAENFDSVLRDSVSQGLRDRGFTPTTNMPTDGRTLKIEIRELHYQLNTGFWVGTLHTDCALKAICQVGQNKPFEKMFRGEHKESVEIAQTADANVKYVNDAVSKAVNDLLGDAELNLCLASPAQSTAQTFQH
jgi:uncharacterized lipoprotein YajG